MTGEQMMFGSCTCCHGTPSLFLCPAHAHQGYRIFNTWLGDPMRLVVLEAVLEQIEKHNLLQNATITGERLLTGIKDIQVRA